MAQKKLDELLDKVFADESGEAASGRPFTELKCWDSLHYVQLVVGVQAVFGVELSSAQIVKLTTLRGLREALSEHGIVIEKDAR